MDAFATREEDEAMSENPNTPSGTENRAGEVQPPSAEALQRARDLIVAVPNFPEDGVTFRDIVPLLADAEGFATVVRAMIAPFAGEFDYLAGLEARGFPLAGAAAMLSGRGMIPLRKAGKLPRPAATVNYGLEYGADQLEVPSGLRNGARVLIIDDVLATGGTLAAADELLRETGAKPVGATVLLELDELAGREKAPDLRIESLFNV